MYLLISLTSDSKKYGLCPGKCYLVGRENGNINLSDISVSRKHANIAVKEHDIMITDLKSSNGTLINSVLLAPKNEHRVIPGSNIQFGAKAKFVLERMNWIVTSSSLPSQQKQLFSKFVQDLGLKVVADWNSNVTHVVSSGLAVTKKIIYALINRQPLVQVEFFKKCLECIRNSKPLPDEQDFMMQRLESQFPVDINYDCNRKCLFAQKVFIFITTEDKFKLEDIVNMCGGKVITINDKAFTEQDLQGEVQYLLVGSGIEQETCAVKSLGDLIKSLGQRTIPSQEISAAVIAGNTKYFCNVHSKVLQQQMPGQHRIKRGEVLVGDTQPHNATYATSAEPHEDVIAEQILSETEDTRQTRGAKRHCEVQSTPQQKLNGWMTVVPKSIEKSSKRVKKSLSDEIQQASYIEESVVSDKRMENLIRNPNMEVALVEKLVKKGQSSKLRLKRGTNTCVSSFLNTTGPTLGSFNMDISFSEENPQPTQRKLTLKRKKDHSQDGEMLEKRHVPDNSTFLKSFPFAKREENAIRVPVSEQPKSKIKESSALMSVSIPNMNINNFKKFKKQNLMHGSIPELIVTLYVSNIRRNKM